MTAAFRAVDIVRRVAGGLQAASDCAATEEPLQIRLHGLPFAVVMRTPGADRDLTAGFLLAERVLQSADDLGTIRQCADQDIEHRDNVIDVTLTGQSALKLQESFDGRRHVVATSSCGLCGRLTIESLKTEGQQLATGLCVQQRVVLELPERLREAQPVFNETGGLHAAGLFRSDGVLQTSAEDIGRHNAVDKVVGRMILRHELPLSGSVLFVSGRASYEIVQKAFLAGIPVVCSVSAPSTLAIDLAHETGMTLIGFVRGSGFNIYSGQDRVL
jgi:FdhD protein